MISNARKTEINLLAQDIVELYTWDNVIEPVTILENNGVEVIFDNYDADFEGLTIYRDKKFFVHINTKYIPQNSLRSRFTLAHEAGHFFIPEHNLELQRSYHPSKFHANETSLIEQEANYFASALLMPDQQFKDFCNRKKFSLEVVEQISKRFGVSRVAVLLRFIEIGNYPLMVAFCQNNKLSWLVRSDDFPYLGAFKSKYGHELPENSVVGEYFKLDNAKYTGIEKVKADDWFYLNDDMINKELNEQCFYSRYGYVVSMVWPD
jgi:Zn-dependent peptidase ImmA (M78 family)